MRFTPAWWGVAWCLTATFALTVCADDRFELQHGDRVVLLGNTLIEREQRYGYWELALTRRYPDRDIFFRNLGWSGDTIFGHARAGFGSTADGFRRLKEQVLAVKPTVIIVSYGLNESFEGEAALPRFNDGLHVLFDTLAATKARVVVLSPPRQEDLGRPWPDPTANNQNLQRYRDALQRIARARQYPFVDLFDLSKQLDNSPLTDNGIHFTADGYRRTAGVMERVLGPPLMPWHIEINQTGEAKAQGATVAKRQRSPLSFEVTDTVLPEPQPPPNSQPAGRKPEPERNLKVEGLAPGRYTLHIDGKPMVTSNAPGWARGVRLWQGPEFDQVEQLRAAIIAKNRHYFYRWRPQNETYLFGFRKHEQGQNAREVPEFDTLTAQLDAEIARLRRPVPHQYQLVLQQQEKQ